MYNDKDFEKWYEKISKQFNDELLQLNEIVEKENKNNSHNFKTIMIILLLFNIILFLAGLLLNMISVSFSTIMFEIMFGVPILIVLMFSSHKESTQKRIDIRKSIIDIMFKSFDNSIEYSPEEGISSEVYNKAGVERYNNYASDHLMSFSINNNYKLQMAETSAYYEYIDRNGERKIESRFSGTFATLNTPKPFKESVYIKKDSHEQYFGSTKKVPLNSTRIELDSQEFEENFDVYASNQIVAMQLLTSDVMVILNDFYKYMGNAFEITIKNDNIYIRVWNNLTFSNSLIKGNELDKELIYKNYRTIKFILNISTKLVELINETSY